MAPRSRTRRRSFIDLPLVFRYPLILVLLTIYFVLGPFGYLAFALYVLLPCRDPDKRARRLQWVMRRAFRLYHDTARVLRIFDYDPRKLGPHIPDGPCVLITNHPTISDFPAVMSATHDVCVAVKPSVFRRWWARPLLEGAGHFAGYDGRPAELERLIDDACDRLARGYRVLIFAEGTRSPREGGVHPFGRSGFEIAKRAGVPIVPLVARCNPRWLIRGQGILNPPAEMPKLRVEALAPIDPTGISSRTLRDMVEAQVRNRLAFHATEALRGAENEHVRLPGISPEEAHRRIADA
jgi:1-acyl-sn-glycerol-3-phosphate acyltransferase